MAKFGKWLGGGLGWAFGGPLGGLLGFALGNLFDVANISTYEDKQDHHTHAGDFSVSLLVLAAAVIKADGKVLKSEIEYIRTFFVNQFGAEKAQEQLLILREILKQEVDLESICLQIRQHMTIPMRLQLIHFLFGISAADNHIHPNELNKIDQIAHLLGLNQSDTASIKAMFYRDETADYKILEIESTSSDEEIKKAYRRMAVKYHPDKVASLGTDVQKAAEEKFKKVQEAYENIKKVRGI